MHQFTIMRSGRFHRPRLRRHDTHLGVQKPLHTSAALTNSHTHHTHVYSATGRPKYPLWVFLCVLGCPLLHKTHDREKSMNGGVCWVRCTQTNVQNIIHHLDAKDMSLPQWVDLGRPHGPALGLSLSLEISVISGTHFAPVLRGKPKTSVGNNYRRSGNTWWGKY